MSIILGLLDAILSILLLGAFIGWLYSIGLGLSWFFGARRKYNEKIQPAGYVIWFSWVLIGYPILASILAVIIEFDI
jgi:hypothetical protein